MSYATLSMQRPEYTYLQMTFHGGIICRFELNNRNCPRLVAVCPGLTHFVLTCQCLMSPDNTAAGAGALNVYFIYIH